jgi:hypothetical protein
MLSFRFLPALAAALVSAFVVFGLTGIAYGDTFSATPRTLKRTLRQVDPGDTVLLAPGEYGALSLQGAYGSAAQRVTLRSEDVQNPARFSALKLEEAQGLILDGLVFEYRFKRRHNPSKRRVNEINNTQHVTVMNSLFDGDNAKATNTTADGYGASFGLSLRWAENIDLENNIFRTFFRGLVISQSRQLTLRNNEIYDMRSDGVDFAEVTDVLVEQNHFHSFRRDPQSRDHADMIQFWTAGTNSPSRNITIRNNVLNAKHGDWTQSIFMRNELVDRKQAGPEMLYQNISITGNVIINAHLHGITLGESKGVEISHNTLVRNRFAQLTNDNLKLHTPSIRLAEASYNVRISNNIVGTISGYEEQQDWRVLRNLIIQEQDSKSPGYYDDVFVSARYGDPAFLGPFIYLRDGPAGQKKVGAPLLRLSKRAAQNANIGPLVQVKQDPYHPQRFRFHEAFNLDETDAALHWTFSDGHKATGQAITHDFATPGQHTVTVQRGSGPPSRLILNVAHPQILLFDGKALKAQANGILKPLGGLTFQGMEQDAQMIALRPGRDIMQIKKDAIAGFFGSGGFTLDLRLRAANTQDPTGEILRIHNNLVVSMTPTGGISFWLNTSETPKPIQIITAPLQLFDQAWHDVSLRYTAQEEKMLILVNGKVAGTGRAQGLSRNMESWGLSFGNPFGKKTFEGDLARLSLQVGG